MGEPESEALTLGFWSLGRWLWGCKSQVWLDRAFKGCWCTWGPDSCSDVGQALTKLMAHVIYYVRISSGLCETAQWLKSYWTWVRNSRASLLEAKWWVTSVPWAKARKSPTFHFLRSRLRKWLSLHGLGLLSVDVPCSPRESWGGQLWAKEREISVLMKSLDECKFWKREGKKKLSKFLA